MFPSKQIEHGIPNNDKYFAIMLPYPQKGGPDCSGIAYGIGDEHTLINPATKKIEKAILINRRSCYTDSDLFESLAFLIYGHPGEEVLDRMKARHDEMCTELIQIWVFKKAE